jgi:hypothetical protein
MLHWPACHDWDRHAHCDSICLRAGTTLPTGDVSSVGATAGSFRDPGASALSATGAAGDPYYSADKTPEPGTGAAPAYGAVGGSGSFREPGADYDASMPATAGGGFGSATRAELMQPAATINPPLGEQQRGSEVTGEQGAPVAAGGTQLPVYDVSAPGAGNGVYGGTEPTDGRYTGTTTGSGYQRTPSGGQRSVAEKYGMAGVGAGLGAGAAAAYGLSGRGGEREGEGVEQPPSSDVSGAQEVGGYREPASSVRPSGTVTPAAPAVIDSGTQNALGAGSPGFTVPHGGMTVSEPLAGGAGGAYADDADSGARGAGIAGLGAASFKQPGEDVSDSVPAATSASTGDRAFTFEPPGGATALPAGDGALPVMSEPEGGYEGAGASSALATDGGDSGAVTGGLTGTSEDGKPKKKEKKGLLGLFGRARKDKRGDEATSGVTGAPRLLFAICLDALLHAVAIM